MAKMKPKKMMMKKMGKGMMKDKDMPAKDDKMKGKGSRAKKLEGVKF